MVNIILDPDMDGITHINVYSKGKTLLGRNLTNMSEVPLKLENHGYFRSMECYWFWRRLNGQYDEFRTMNPFVAKREGTIMVQSPFNNVTDENCNEFKEDIKNALRVKLKQNPSILFDFLKTDLPLTHYYVKGSVVMNHPEYKWELDELERIRKICHEKMYESGQLKIWPISKEEIKKVNKPKFR